MQAAQLSLIEAPATDPTHFILYGADKIFFKNSAFYFLWTESPQRHE